MKWAMIYSVILFLPFFFALMAVPQTAMKLFDASDFMLGMGVPAVRILSVAWLAAIPSLVIAAGLQGLSLGTHSMLLTMVRQVILPVVFALALRLTGKVEWIWTGFILAELLGFPLALTLWRRAYRSV